MGNVFGCLVRGERRLKTKSSLHDFSDKLLKVKILGKIPVLFMYIYVLHIYIHITYTYIYAQTGTFADPTVQRFELFFPFECGVSFFLYFKKHFLLVVQANRVHQAEKHSKG